MTEPNDPARAPEHPVTVPRGTTPTWEIEMLLSGAVVFALMQVPGVLDASFDRVFLKLPATLSVGSLLVYSYVKAIVYALVLTFIAHLAARAYWIALVGIDSVYPDGPRWDRLKTGPILREMARRDFVPLKSLIARADDRCSLIFSSGILLVMFALFSLVLTSAITGVAFLVSHFTLGDRYWIEIMLGFTAVVALPAAIAGVWDRYRGHRLDPEGRAANAIRTISRLNQRVMLAPTLPMLYTLSTNRPRQRIYAVLVVAMLAILYFVMGEVLVRREVLQLDLYPHLPDRPTSYALDPDHYEDRREPGSATTLPYIQSEIVAGRYVRLFVPYLTERHEAGLAHACPGLRPLAQSRFVRRTDRLDDARTLETLGCFGKMLAFQLDGAPIAPDLSFGSDARSGHRGIVAMIPVSDLAPGRHVVALRRPPRPNDELPKPGEEMPASGEAPKDAGSNDASTELRYEIPFWR